MNYILSLRDLRCAHSYYDFGEARFAANGLSPLQEVQRNRCAFQISPCGAYRRFGTLRYKLSPYNEYALKLVPRLPNRL